MTFEREDLAWLDDNGGNDRLQAILRNARLHAQDPVRDYAPGDLIV